jgi:ATP-dependent Lon protease
MPFYPLPSAVKNKKGSSPPKQDKEDSDSERESPRRLKSSPKQDDSSVDERGNVRNLIDYDYEESTESSELPPRKAKKRAKKLIRRYSASGTMNETETSTDSTPHIVVKEVRRRKQPVVESDEELPKRKTARKPEPETESEEEEIVPTSKSRVKSKSKKSRVVESETESEYEEPPRRRTAKKRYVESEEESEEEAPSRHRRKASRRRYETESEEEEDYDDEDEDEEEDEEDEEDEGGHVVRGRINLFDLIGGGTGPQKPKKYNLKKEPANVQRFVELVQKEDEEEDNIDNDITYFKSLTAEKQMNLMKVLELKATPVDVQTPLKFKILEKISVNPELGRIAMAKYQALMNIDPSTTEYYKCSHWINGFTSLPLGNYRDLPVKLEDGPEKCNTFMETVHKCMDGAIFGHDEAKLQIMQFISSWIANPKAHGNVLSIHGPPGIGKTSLVKDGIAKALDRPFHFITLGGATDASFLDGHSYTYEGSTWGKIVDILIQSKCMNPIIYFDELDKVSQTPKGEEIMNMLIHITDGSQNDRFQDKYFTGINLDLSRCLFIFSHNNHEAVNPILRDRMYNIAVKGFNMKEKLVIAERHLLNAALMEVGLFEKVSVHRDIIQYIIEHFTGGEQGVRELKRCIQTVVSKINLLRFFNNPKQVPFSIKDFSLPFTVKKEHIDLFIKRKDSIDPSIAHLYC